MDREFSRARRHTILVKALRIGLPLGAVAIVAGGVAVTFLARSLPDNVSVASAGIGDGGIVMEDPRMSGFDKNNRPYSMDADRAVQSLTGGGVDLQGVRAKLTVSEDSTAEIVAAKGFYDQAGQKLRLSNDITVATSDGMRIALGAADVDLKTGSLQGTGPVDILSDNRTIKAGSIAVKDGGAFISFGQRVRMTIQPPAGDAPARDLSSNEPR